MANNQPSICLKMALKMKSAPTKVLLPFAPGSDVMTALTEGCFGEEATRA